MARLTQEQVRARDVAEFISTHAIDKKAVTVLQDMVTDVTGSPTTLSVLKDDDDPRNNLLRVETGLESIIKTGADAIYAISLYERIDQRMLADKRTRRLVGKVLVVG